MGLSSLARSLSAVTMAALLVATGACNAIPGLSGGRETWPTEPVTLIVPLDPGSGLDALVRPIATQLEKELGVPVRVENRPGGGSTVGTSSLLTEPDDGSVLLAVNTSQLSVSSLRTGQYVLGDFRILGAFEVLHGGTFVRPGSPHRTAVDLLRAIRERPGQLSVAHTGGSEALIFAQLRSVGLDVREVQFEGAAGARAAVLAGDVDFFQSGFEPTLAVVAPGELLPLAVDAKERLASHPDVPTMHEALAELEISDLDLPGAEPRLFLVRPSFAEKHPDRLRTLLAALERAVDSPEVKAFSDQRGSNIEWIPEQEATEAAQGVDELIRRFEEMFR